MNRKVVIIGGGVAGLSAGIYSRLNGFETEIIEMHSVTGGQCTAWKRKGFRFDFCLHWLAGTRKGPFNEIWKVTDVLNDTVEIIDHEIHTKIINEKGEEFLIYKDLDKWEAYLCRLAPGDKRRIRKMCSEMRRSTFLKPFSDPPGLRTFIGGISSMIGMLPVFPLFIKYGGKNCNEYFRKIGFKDDTLKGFLDSLYGSRDFSALAFIMMFAWFNQKNAGYLSGGSRPLAERMTRKFTELGGKLTTGKRVSKVIVENNNAGGVITTDGSIIKADYVISAADGHSTIFDMLDGRYLNKKISDAYTNWELFTPVVQVSFGIDKYIESLIPVEVYIINDLTIGRTTTKYGYSVMNYFFDPTMAPEGKSVIIIRFESPWDLWENISPDEYKDEKKKIESDVRSLLENRFPGISEHIEVTDVATPLTDVRYTGVWKGSYEGFMPSGHNLMSNLSPVLPGLKKFYMAGQWLFPGGGLPPAAQSGKWAVQYICREEKIRFKAH
jgi:phytoene dehydrogenase-like protein